MDKTTKKLLEVLAELHSDGILDEYFDLERAPRHAEPTVERLVWEWTEAGCPDSGVDPTRDSQSRWLDSLRGAGF